MARPALEATPVSAPLIDKPRMSIGRVWLTRRHRWAVGLCLGWLVVAACADFVASDLPIALRWRGRTYLCPQLTRPASLRAYDNRALGKLLREDDWAILPLIAWGPNTHDLEAVLEAPSRRHWFGTDSGGRDVLARTVHGARVSLLVGLCSVVFISCVGIAVGLSAGYYGGLWDALAMRVVDVLHAVPTLLLIVTALTLVHPTGYWVIAGMAGVIGAVRWTDLARLVRAQALRVRASAYIEAAEALGLAPRAIMLRHMLPNVAAPALVAASFSMAAAIAIESALSFLGFGMPPDIASWGGLLSDARMHVDAWWLAVFPGASVFIGVLVYNVLGDGLRDALDPTLEL
jgi:peptide/nickel transport system permease protein